MRHAAALLALSLSACAVFGRGRSDYTDATVASSAATTLTIARTQLQHHGFTVTSGGENVLVTAPKPIQRYQRDSTGAAAKGDRWFLRVEVEPATFTAGSRLRVNGFVIPRVPAKSGTGTQPQLQAIPIESSDKQLYADVRAAARWIVDEANRQGPRQSGGERPR